MLRDSRVVEDVAKPLPLVKAQGPTDGHLLAVVKLQSCWRGYATRKVPPEALASRDAPRVSLEPEGGLAASSAAHASTFRQKSTSATSIVAGAGRRLSRTFFGERRCVARVCCACGGGGGGAEVWVLEI